MNLGIARDLHEARIRDRHLAPARPIDRRIRRSRTR